MCMGSSPTPPPPAPPPPPPPVKRAATVQSATTSNRTGIRKKRGTSQLTTRRPVMGGIQTSQSGVRI